jgi:hypothetical protein
MATSPLRVSRNAAVSFSAREPTGSVVALNSGRHRTAIKQLEIAITRRKRAGCLPMGSRVLMSITVLCVHPASPTLAGAQAGQCIAFVFIRLYRIADVLGRFQVGIIEADPKKSYVMT